MAYKFQRGAFTASGSLVQVGGNITAETSNDITALALKTTNDNGGSGNIECATLDLDGGGIRFEVTAGGSVGLQIMQSSSIASIATVNADSNNTRCGKLTVGHAAQPLVELGLAHDTDATRGATKFGSYLTLKNNTGTIKAKAFGETGTITANKFTIGAGNSTIANDCTVVGNLTVEGSLIQMNNADGILVAEKHGRIAASAANKANSLESGFNVCADGSHPNGGAIRYVEHANGNGRHFVFAKKNGNNFDGTMATLPAARRIAVKADKFFGDGDNLTALPTMAVTTHTTNATLSARGLHLVNLVGAGGDVTLTLPDGNGLAGGQIFKFKIISNAESSAGKKLVINMHSPGDATDNVVVEEGGDIATFDVTSDYAAVSLIQGNGSTALKRKWSIH